MDLVGLNVLCS